MIFPPDFEISGRKNHLLIIVLLDEWQGWMKDLETELEKFSDADAQMIRRYLLADLSAEEEEFIGTKLLSTPGAEEMLSVVEEELFEDYAAGRLSPNFRAAFERVYLKTEKGRENIRFFQSLHRAAQNIQRSKSPKTAEANIKADAAPEKPDRFQTFRDRLMNLVRQPVYGLALILILIGTVGLLIWLPTGTKRAAMEREIARLNQTADAAKEIYDIPLNPYSIRASGEKLPEVQARGKQGVIRFQLNLTGSADSYRAVFFDGTGTEVFAVSNLVPQNLSDGKALVFFVPAQFFNRDDYRIAVQGVSPDKSLNEARNYEFRVM